MKYPITQLDFSQDFSSFIDLSRAIYGHKAVTDEEMYHWLFQENRYNPQHTHLFHVAKDGDKVVASDCLFPVPLVVAGKQYLAAWSIKTMTHPDYQRQGIFKAMTQYNIDRARELGIDVILGFANSSSFPGYKKFGWDILVERKAVLRPLDIEQSLAKRRWTKPVAGLGNRIYKLFDRRRLAAMASNSHLFTVDIRDQAPSTSDEIWPSMREAFPLLVKRDFAYLDWRYNQRPRHDYKFVLARGKEKIEAMLVFRTTAANSCIIVDYVGKPQSLALPGLLHATIEYCHNNKLRYIINSSGQVFDNQLIKYGFKYLQQPLENNMFIACRLNSSISLEQLKEPTNWFYSYGDSELDIDLQPR